MASNWRPQIFFIAALSCFAILTHAEVITAQDIIYNIQNIPIYSESNEVTTTEIPLDEDDFQTTNTVSETTTLNPDTRRRSGKFKLEYNLTPKEISESFLEDDELFIPLGLHQSHPCRRTCVTGSTMTCRYNFTIEWYQTMSKACYDCPYTERDCFRPDCVPADGMSRPITVVNRMMPGPSIEVCQGDKVIVDVSNALMVEGTTIHWHGHHQRGTPYMDGTPFVTQCPIQSGSTFRYHFHAVHAGTHFWHSHAGMQRADGAAGAFIVRKPHDAENHAYLYNYDRSEHVMIVTDWVHELSLNTFTDHHHSTGRDANKPPALLINGLGRFRQFPKNQTKMARTDKVETDEIFYMNTAKFVVEQGYKYRFRIINAEFLNCPIELSIDNHTLTIISSDGYDFEPIEATSLVTYAGERFDFILDANQRAENYWIRYRGLMDCDERFTQAWQVAILHYDTALDIDPPGNVDSWHASHNDGLQVNALNSGTEDSETISIPQLKSLEPADITLKPEADVSYYISYDFYAKNNSHFHKENLYGFHQVPDVNNRLYTPQLNHMSMKLPATPFLLDRRDEQPSCDAVTGGIEGATGGSRVRGAVKVQRAGEGRAGVELGGEGVDCRKQYCECSHVVDIPLGTVVELILVDEGVTFDANHPFHLHGHAFRVIAMERLSNVTTVEEIRAHDAAGRIHRNLLAPPYKDTVTVPDGGYTVIRWLADNPGYWLFHCHIEFHAEVGMSLVFKVGSRKDMAPLPYKFPSCGSWTPDEEVLKPKSTETSGFWLWSWWPVEHYNATSGCQRLAFDVRILAYSLVIGSFYVLCH